MGVMKEDFTEKTALDCGPEKESPKSIKKHSPEQDRGWNVPQRAQRKSWPVGLRGGSF